MAAMQLNVLPTSIRSRLKSIESMDIVAFCGAGISAASGIPTFRGTTSAGPGMWEKYRAEELATPNAFRKDPILVWKWYQMRMGWIFNAKPNPAHLALTQLERAGFLRLIVTQNVDDLHERAGSTNVLHLHGEIRKVKCVGSVTHYFPVKEIPEQVPPECPTCGEILRPNVVWFGEGLDHTILETAFRAMSCEILLVIGTSALIFPAAQLPIEAKRNGAIVLEFNPETTPVTSFADFSFTGAADVHLPAFVEMLEGLVNS